MEKKDITKGVKTLSIIIPAYNSEKYIKRVIENIEEQENIVPEKEVQIILVNDGSKDKTLEIMKEYQEKYSNIQIIDKKNEGLSKARNDAVKLVETPYFIFLDSDDFLDKDALEIILSNIKNQEKEEELDLFKYNLKSVTEDEEIVSRNKSINLEKVKGEEALAKLGFGDKLFMVATLLAYRTEYYKNNGFEFEAGRYHEDYGLIPFIILNASKISTTDQMLYNYVLSENSITRDVGIAKIIKKAEDTIYLYKKAIEKAESFYLEEKISKEVKKNLKQIYTNGLIEKAREVYKIKEEKKKEIMNLKDKQKTPEKEEELKNYIVELEKILKQINRERLYKNIKIRDLKSLVKKILIMKNIECYLKRT